MIKTSEDRTSSSLWKASGPLIMLLSLENTKQITFTLYVHACVYNMMGPKLRICLACLSLFLDQLGLFILCWVALLVAFNLAYGWLMMRQMLPLFYFMFSMA